MNRTASKNHEWVWTALTESLRGKSYPAGELRKEGQPIYERCRRCCPASWVEKGYVRESPIEGQLAIF